MDHEDDDEAVGYKRPPKKHRFSAENQPTRRRKRRKKNDLGSGLYEALTRPITITVGGIKQTMELHEAFSQSIVHDALKAPLPQKLKAMAMMEKMGLAGLLSSTAKFDRDVAEFEEERRGLAQRERVTAVLLQGAQDEASECKAKWYVAAKALQEVTGNCSCGASNTLTADDVAWLLAEYESEVECDAQWEEELRRLRRLEDELRRDADIADEDDVYDDEYAVEYDSDDNPEDDHGYVGDGCADDPELDVGHGQLGSDEAVTPERSTGEESSS